MEILTRGEKIRRARIYKGFTLKQVCGDEISVSKLSCIENNKIEAEHKILSYIANKLDLDLKYLQKSIKDELRENLNYIKNNRKDEDYIKNLKYNLKIAEENKIYDLAFEFMHELFNYYIKINSIEDIQLLTKDYYCFYQKICSSNNSIIYYIDMAKYCYVNNEFQQCINYCNNITKFFAVGNKINNKYLVTALYNQILCNIKLHNYKNAYEISKQIEDIIDYEKDLNKKAEIYSILAIIALKMDRDSFNKYESKAYELFNNDFEKIALAMYSYASMMFKINEKDKAIRYITVALNKFPKCNKEKYVRFMLDIINELLKNKILDLSKNICDEVLNYAIELNKIEFIERAYYYKALTLIKSKEYLKAETYMNLCLDSLVKFGSNKQLYDRYLEMGEMYYCMEDISESLKYFDLAIKMEKNL